MADVVASTQRVAAGKSVKLVVWDLDDTVWTGALLEGGAKTLAPGVADVIRRLDARGVLHSIASRNEPAPALERLVAFELADYFLRPEIGWGAKSMAVQAIAQALNIAPDAVLFVDDQPFERAEVAHALPAVRTFDAAFACALADDPLLTPAIVTEEARRRRLAYQEDAARDDFERAFEGPSEAFLRTLDLTLTIAPAAREDLQRAEELTLRTSQLNSTGVTYSFADLDALRRRDDHLLLVAGLTDRFGDYGVIGLALIETRPAAWRLKLLLASCRVLSRGVGGVLLGHVLRKARTAGVALTADFRPTDRNRPMQIAYRFSGFHEAGRDGDIVTYAHDLKDVPGPPGHFRIVERL